MAYDLLLPTPVLDLLMFVYPAYCSVAALKDNDRDKIIQFMTYWMVFAAFATVEGFLYFFLRFVPMYTVARRAFCIWCILPLEHNGGTFIYSNVVEGLFSEMSEEVNHLSQMSFQQMRRILEEVAHRVLQRRRAGDAQPAPHTPLPPEQELAVTAISPVISGLEQLRDKAEAYRDQVMEQVNPPEDARGQ